MQDEDITSEDLLNAYASGYFPMAESRDTPDLYWFNPTKRGVIPLEAFHVPASLRKRLKKKPFEIAINRAFEGVIRACAEIPRSHEQGTWINDRIIALYCELHRLGHAHSVESWQDGRLVGGLYGVSLGGAFFGESMFSRESDASKVALVALVSRLRACGYVLLDTQFVNPHLLQFGVVEMSKARYLRRLDKALALPDPSLRFALVDTPLDLGECTRE